MYLSPVQIHFPRMKSKYLSYSVVFSFRWHMCLYADVAITHREFVPTQIKFKQS